MDFHTSLVSITLFILLFSLVLYGVYRLALPKPIPGIPYIKSSAHNVLGDLPAMASHIAKTDGTFITYISSVVQTLNAPLVQVFFTPLSKPLLILADFREAQDILVHRTDFDRSSSLGDLLTGVAPNLHIRLKTNTEWKAHRRLVGDLMTPSFLHNIAGPVVYHKAIALMDLWKVKSSIAVGKPWRAADDLINAALDAVMAFTFGGDLELSATRPTLEAINGLDTIAIELLRSTGSQDKPFNFPKGQKDDLLQSWQDLTGTIGEVQGHPLPTLKWAYVNQKPSIKKATKLKEDHITRDLKRAVEKLAMGKETVVRSAVDQMIVRERSLAEKEQRKPDYFSRVMFDEIFGFIFGGLETTSTTLSWGLKFLTDNPTVQHNLRIALQKSFTAAKSERRDPSIQDITTTQIPYLDATIEEIIRCAHTAPIVDRQAVVDTELLGYRIPKGTIVSCLGTGSSMMSPSFEIDESRRSASSHTLKNEAKHKAWDPHNMSVFQPERWLVTSSSNEKEFEFDAAAGPQLAFGLGTRGCYGKRLAYLQLRILLTLIVWNFELLPCPEALSGYTPVLGSTYKPRDCYVRLRQVELE